MIKCFLVCFFLICLPSLAEAIDSLHCFKAEQGVAVYWVERHELPVIDIRLVWDAGSAQDGKQAGLAFVTSQLIGQGSLRLNSNQIAKNFDQVGAVFSTDVKRDQAWVDLRTLSAAQYADPALKLLHEVVVNAKWNASDFSRIQKQTLAAIQASEQDPGVVAENKLYQALYPQNSYGHPVMGSIGSIQNLSLGDAASFYRHFYVAPGAQLIIIGDVTADQVRTIAHNLLSGLPAAKLEHRALQFQQTVHQAVIHVHFPSEQTALLMGGTSLTLKDPDFFAFLLANHVLGQMPLTSILFNTLRDQKGLTYGVRSQLKSLMQTGLWTIGLKTRNQQASLAASLVQNILVKYWQQGPTDAQFRASQMNMIRSFPAQIASNADLFYWVTQIAFYHLPLNYLETYVSKLQSVSKEEAKASFQKSVDPKRMVTVWVGP